MVTHSTVTKTFLFAVLCASSAVFGMGDGSQSTSQASNGNAASATTQVESSLETSKQLLAELRNTDFYTIDNDGTVYVNSESYIHENWLSPNYRLGYGIRRDDLTEAIRPAFSYEQWIINVAQAGMIALFLNTYRNQQQAHCG